MLSDITRNNTLVQSLALICSDKVTAIRCYYKSTLPVSVQIKNPLAFQWMDKAFIVKHLQERVAENSLTYIRIGNLATAIISWHVSCFHLLH